ncbi:hypothetical protein [Corynebacterium jeikeium]|uniref:hypothetical protein n=1 Tax=Corynebacterium jeikeium TaxID=38289 RepID=UPI00087EF536|nr:hypothetical protein [Corynebacterium jeikeium]SCX11516.1 hypothetical protein CJBVI_0831 [Corynebacterium jeikeium]
MAEKRTRLADTVRKGQAAQKKKPVAVADTFANKDAVLDRRTTIYLSQDNWKALKLRSVEEDKNLSELINDLVTDYLSAK